jgi:hypothetical protein
MEKILIFANMTQSDKSSLAKPSRHFQVNEAKRSSSSSESCRFLEGGRINNDEHKQNKHKQHR